MNFSSPYSAFRIYHSAFLALAFSLWPLALSLLSPPSAFATCYCVDPLGDDCRCTTSVQDAPDNPQFPGNQSGVEVKCTTQAEANSTFEKKNPICGSASETIPYCAPVTYDSSRYFCYGRGFIPPDAVDDQIKSMSDNSWKVVNGPFQFNGTFGGSTAYNVYVCDSGVFCCGQPGGTCSETGLPKGQGCTPQTGPGNPAVCENIPPPGGGTGTPAPKPTTDYPPPGTLCENYEYKNEPHPLRPAPALACQKQVPEPWGLSCANDAVPIVTIGRPRTTTHPGDSDQGPKYETVCSFDGPYGRANCTRFELLTKNIIGEVEVTIDLTGLELPIAGIASRNCDTGECDVDEKDSDGKLYLTDGFKMRNYTSWYLQGAIEQSEQEPLDYFDAGDTLKRVLAYAGPIKKLIPEESLTNEKRELIAMVEQNNSYNAIVGYIDAGQVISRRQAREKGLTDKSHVVRVKDMPKYNPGWDPHAEDGGIGYYLWRQMPFTGKDINQPQNAGQVDVAGEIFPTACLKSQTNLENCTSGPCRCQSDEKVLDAEFKVTSGLESFKLWYPHLVEDETLLASLLQKALVSSDIPQTEGYPTFSQLKVNLDKVDRKPEWTEADGHAWINADGCKRENALWNEGDSLEAKRNQTEGLIKGKLKFKREVDYSYQAETDASRDYINRCNAGGWGNCPTPLPDEVDVPAKSPIPVHIRYSHMNEIGDLTVFGKGSVFKALYPDIPETIGPEIPERPAESSIAYRCSAKNGSCKASSTSHKDQPPMAFFPRWGSTLELFHQKIQAMLDPLFNVPYLPGQNTAILGTDYLVANYPPFLLRQLVTPSAEKIAALLEKIKIWQTQPRNTWVGSQFEKNYQKIIDFGLANNLNPALLLALYLEESHGEAAGDFPMGCGGATTLDASLDCLAHDPAIDAYRDASLAEFMCRYADGHYPCDYAKHPNFIKNLFDFYNQLAP